MPCSENPAGMNDEEEVGGRHGTASGGGGNAWDFEEGTFGRGLPCTAEKRKSCTSCANFVFA